MGRGSMSHSTPSPLIQCAPAAQQTYSIVFVIYHLYMFCYSACYDLLPLFASLIRA